MLASRYDVWRNIPSVCSIFPHPTFILFHLHFLVLRTWLKSLVFSLFSLCRNFYFLFLYLKYLEEWSNVLIVSLDAWNYRIAVLKDITVYLIWLASIIHVLHNKCFLEIEYGKLEHMPSFFFLQEVFIWRSFFQKWWENKRCRSPKLKLKGEYDWHGWIPDVWRRLCFYSVLRGVVSASCWICLLETYPVCFSEFVLCQCVRLSVILREFMSLLRGWMMVTTRVHMDQIQSGYWYFYIHICFHFFLIMNPDLNLLFNNPISWYKFELKSDLNIVQISNKY